ncbi:hypothetical protein DL96DRAFT_1628571, partial [Flagelloscypha sp. PMI_526]
MTQFPDLPLDICCLIVATAVMRDATLGTGSSLSCVSRLVQSWVDPLLFRNLKFGYNKNPKDYLILHLSSQSPRLSRTRPFVWSISFQQDLELGDFQELISLHRNIKFLSFNELPPAGAEALWVPSLTDLSAPFGYWDELEDMHLSGPLFVGIKHLDLHTMSIKSIPEVASHLLQMRSLEAILIGASGWSFEAILEGLKALPPTLNLVVLSVAVWNMKNFWDLSTDTQDLAKGKMDPREVVAIWCHKRDDVPPDFVEMGNSAEIPLWYFCGSQEDTVWDEARAIQARRMTDKN